MKVYRLEFKDGSKRDIVGVFGDPRIIGDGVVRFQLTNGHALFVENVRCMFDGWTFQEIPAAGHNDCSAALRDAFAVVFGRQENWPTWSDQAIFDLSERMSREAVSR